MNRGLPNVSFVRQRTIAIWTARRLAVKLTVSIDSPGPCPRRGVSGTLSSVSRLAIGLRRAGPIALIVAGSSHETAWTSAVAAGWLGLVVAFAGRGPLWPWRMSRDSINFKSSARTTRTTSRRPRPSSRCSSLATPSVRRGSTTPIAHWPSSSRSSGSGRSSWTSTPIPKAVSSQRRRPGPSCATLGKDPGEDPDSGGVLRKPGLKILHVPDIDFRTTAPTFVDALKQIRTWSQANRRHVPILILVELKEDALPGLPTRPVPFGKDEIDSVDAEILSVFQKNEILTPDRVRGKFASLPEAIKAQGWPKLDDVRGLVMFALDNEGSVRDRYLEGHPRARGSRDVRHRRAR